MERALPGSAEQLLRTLRAALDSSSFMVNGGRLGFPCQVRGAIWPMRHARVARGMRMRSHLDAPGCRCSMPGSSREWQRHGHAFP